jgi:hypothetical protein
MMAVLPKWSQEQREAVAAILVRELGVDPARVDLDSFSMESNAGDTAILRVESVAVVPLDVVNEILRAFR